MGLEQLEEENKLLWKRKIAITRKNHKDYFHKDYSKKKKDYFKKKKEKDNFKKKVNERQYQLRAKELIVWNKTKRAVLHLDPTFLDVTKHIRLVPLFPEKEVDKYFNFVKMWLKI